MKTTSPNSLLTDHRGLRRGIERGPNYREEFKLVHRARTLPPTEVMTAIAATTMRPAIRAYSSTSPPFSSQIRFLSIFFAKAFMTPPEKFARASLHEVRTPPCVQDESTVLISED